MALISLVDEDRQWFKARMGLDVCSTSREVAFCAHVVELEAVLIVEDAALDPRFANNPLVTGPPFIRFYAGAPLITPEGHVLGSLCVLDTKPRTLTDTQRELLIVLSRQVMDQLAHRRQADALAAEVARHEEVQAQLNESAAFHDAVLAASPDIIFVVDRRTHTSVWSSRNLMGLLGYEVEQITNMGSAAIETLVHPDDVANLMASNDAACSLLDGAVQKLRYRARHADGHWLWLSRRTTPFARDEFGVVTQLLGVARDITDVVEVEQRLEAAALHDALTGLPNRTLLADRLGSALSRAGRTGQEVPVLFCDLDGFKRVNDTAGHAAGDAVLAITAQRLQSQLRQVDTVARVGGDEFVIVVEPLVEPGGENPGSGAEGQESRRSAKQIADRIMAVVSEPIVVGDVAHVVTASIGITLARPGASPDVVLRDADAAMYRAKSLGKNRTVISGADH
jgi:diguanylate cyclase (GGDEF)-like protein/PAS domain S-box-containing protein